MVVTVVSVGEMSRFFVSKIFLKQKVGLQYTF